MPTFRTNGISSAVDSTALLVTKVNDGTVGTDPGDVPPVGSVVDYVSLGNTGFGTYYSAMPSAIRCSNDIQTRYSPNRYSVVHEYNASKDPSDYTFYDPFAGT